MVPGLNISSNEIDLFIHIEEMFILLYYFIQPCKMLTKLKLLQSVEWAFKLHCGPELQMSVFGEYCVESTECHFISPGHIDSDHMLVQLMRPIAVARVKPRLVIHRFLFLLLWHALV